MTGGPLRFRPLVPADQHFLWDVLHVALWDPPPAQLRPRGILAHPEVRIYAEGWGREGDVGVVALAGADAQPAGAAWMRLVTGGQGLAWVDERTPQLGIALLPRYQRRGYGEPLLRAALAAAREHGYTQVSLTVHPQNPAISLYEKCGFRKVELRRAYHLMVAAP
jgi:ribosomal protein S18 acetylase RimI-like enzyme